MLTISDLAPDAGLKSSKNYNRTWEGKSAFAALWRAESYIKQRNIESDIDKIHWFLRGASDKVVVWYARSKDKNFTKWTQFKVAYVRDLESPQDKRLLFSLLQQEDWMSTKDYLLLLAQLFPKYTHIAIRKIISKFSPDISDKLRRWMQQRPTTVGRLEWLCIAADRFAPKWKSVSHQPSKVARGQSNVDILPVQSNSSKTYENVCTNRDTLSFSTSGLAEQAPEYEPPENSVARSDNNRTPKVRHDTQRTPSTKTGIIKPGITANFAPEDTSPVDLAHTSECGDLNIRFDQLSDLKKYFPLVLDNEIKPRPPCPIEECVIETPLNKQVQVQWQGRIPEAHLEATRTTIANLEKAQIIRRSDSQWRNPIRPVIKPDGSVRICTNLIMLNKLVISDPYSIPLMPDIIEKMQGARYFTLIDLKDGYFQIPIREQDRHKTAFKFEHSLYEWCRMPMGYKNAPALFQRIMDTILNDRLGRGVNVYLDDIVIYGKTKNEHDAITHWVFQRLKENNLIANHKKIQFCLPEIKLLGFKVDGTRVSIIPEIKDEINSFPRPDSTPGLRRFLGKINVYRDFIKDLAAIATPLYERTGPHTKFMWSPSMEDAFISLKEKLSEAIALFHPDYKRPFILETDASDTGIGAVLLQYNEKGQKVPIRWISRKLSPAERNYGITEKELLGVVWSIKHLDYILRGRHFSVITDHKALTVIQSKDDFGNPRMHRWISSIQEYDFDIAYRQGSEMHSADALSRIYERSATEYTSQNNKTDCPSNDDLTGDENSDNRRTEETSTINDNEAKLELVQKAHEELLHRSMEPMLYELRKSYTWPNMRQLISIVLARCETCNKNNRKHGGGSNFIDTAHRLEKTAIDIMKVDGTHPYILIFIDFYTRIMKIHSLRSRTSTEIIGILEGWFETLGKPKEINTDNALEFTSNAFKTFCQTNQIRHHLTSIEKHEANGRVERVIRTVRDGLAKTKNQGCLTTRLLKIQDAYNKSLHSATGMSPNDAWEDTGETLKMANSTSGKYAQQFKALKREKFEIGQRVRISKKENLKIQGKSNERFQDTGIILDMNGNDSYTVQDSSGRVIKRSHAHLKSFEQS
ncbi:hypothetical protein ENBRE01_0846 [Enteropsectra breve]|nr:hypothetical protein ENBRE01_0846 [Enteropsectra breve]